MQPELTANVQLVGGGRCGEGLAIHPATDVTSITLDFHGQPMRYDFDSCDGLWYHVPPSQAPAESGDRIYAAVVNAVGEATLIELMALIAVREMCKGNIQFWRAMAERVDRMREAS